MDSLSFQPNVYSPVAIGALAFCLALTDLLGQRQILCRNLHSLCIPIVAAARDAEKAAHFTDAVLLTMTVDYLVFDAGLHSFPVSERKSRSNSTSIFNRLFSYLYSCKVFAGFLPRCFGIPASLFQLCIAHRLIPYFKLNALWLLPSFNSVRTFSRIPAGYFFIPFFPDIQTPPDVVILLHQGAFVYCPFLLVQFKPQSAVFLSGKIRGDGV